ncbi:hypothetical protein PFLA_a4112 [Pseudoalteromonas flavipulchra NCIMB 2033 = ATCC BAA-314]|nr:hypothetical protein [Pseudoalteromonas flavipulchra NCIMB 2033 = ATCC BAA-314]
MVCNVFDIARSSFYDYKRRRNIIDVNEIKLRAQLNACFNLSRGAAGSRKSYTLSNACRFRD